MPQKDALDLDTYFVKYWKLVIYGPPGVGKSVLGGMSSVYRTFIFDVDEGISSVKANRNKHSSPQGMVKIWTVKTYQDFMDGWKWLCAHYKEFDLIVIDTMTELHGTLKREVMKRNSHDTAEIRDWGSILDTIDDVSALFKSTPWHVLILAHETLALDPSTGEYIYRPSFRGSWKNEYARHVSIIGRYMMWWTNEQSRDSKGQLVVTKKLNRWINFGPDPGIHFKDRSAILNRFEKPDIDYLLNKMIASQGDYDFSQETDSGLQLQPEDPSQTAATEALRKLATIENE